MANGLLLVALREMRRAQEANGAFQAIPWRGDTGAGAVHGPTGGWCIYQAMPVLMVGFSMVLQEIIMINRE